MRKHTLLFGFALVLCGRTVQAQQVEVTVQGGVHAARLERPERRFGQMESTSGEAASLGLRLGNWFANHWGVDAGVAWSRNRSWQGSTTLPPPTFDIETVFTSVLLRVRLRAPGTSFTVSGGIGPAVIIHRGDGASLLNRQTDVGAMVTAAAEARVFSRVGFRIDVQNYMFSSNFAESYQPALVGSPAQPAGEQFRHEWVVLAGATFHLRN